MINILATVPEQNVH